jgi:hypothetical protein
MAGTNGHNTDSQVTFLEAIKQAMFEEMERDPSVILIGEDVGVSAGSVLSIRRSVKAPSSALLAA